jgi:dTDP-4-amino-4,6-dideoxygalactose transaminase
MINMSKPIFIATHPNFEKDDFDIVSKNFPLLPNENDTRIVLEFEKIVGEYFNRKALAIDSARSALFILLKTLNLEQGSEVILPAFSCMVVSNAVKWAGLKPVFVDCNKENFNYDQVDLKNKLTQNSKVILIQHTFGYPEEMNKIKGIVGDDVFIVEDLAHSLGGSLDGRKLGTFGDAAILTFGIEKVISSIRGGMLVIKDEEIARKAKNAIEELKPFPKKSTYVSLYGVKLWKFCTPIYYFGIGKLTLGRLIVFIAHKLGLMGNMIEDCEYDTCQPSWLPAKMSPTLAFLGINQFKKLERFNEHRIEIAKIYSKELGVFYTQEVGSKHIFIRFPIILEKRDELLLEAKKKKIVLGDWYKNILYAPDKTLSLLGYVKGSCPNAEYLAKRVANLPTFINLSKEDALRISNLVKKFL